MSHSYPFRLSLGASALAIAAALAAPASAQSFQGSATVAFGIRLPSTLNGALNHAVFRTGAIHSRGLEEAARLSSPIILESEQDADGIG